MDPIVTNILVALATTVGTRVGDFIGQSIVEQANRFLNSLRRVDPNAAQAVEQASQQTPDYNVLFRQVEAAAISSDDVRNAVNNLAKNYDINAFPQLMQILHQIASQLKIQSPEVNLFAEPIEPASPEEISKYITDATPNQADRFSTQLQRLHNLQAFFRQYPSELALHKDNFQRAVKALNYKQPYRIAVIGRAGAGKSTLLNAMLGRDLLQTRDGGSVTGAKLQIFLDVPSHGVERAIVEYRNEENIRELLFEFAERYQLDRKLFERSLSRNLAEQIQALTSNVKTIDSAANDFNELRESLADLVRQFDSNLGQNLQTEFILNRQQDFDDLRSLVDENSTQNQRNSPFRRIGLVQSVTYHLKSRSSNGIVQPLNLPGNVCLVDFPGLDGSPLHDMIITEGIKDADAVIFILRIPRVNLSSDNYLMDRVKKYIGSNNNVEAGERIFLVLNALDQISTDKVPADLDKAMRDLMAKLVPDYAKTELAMRGGDHPYFMTCALAGLMAQKELRREPISNPDTYRASKTKLGVENGTPEQVLAASQIPKLVEELSKFASDRRIEGQISEGKQAIDWIFNTLKTSYQQELEEIRTTAGISSPKSKIIAVLTDTKKTIYDKIIAFRKNLLKNHFPRWRDQLKREADKECFKINQKLKEDMPEIWKRAVSVGTHRLTGEQYLGVSYEQVLGDTEANLWHQLAFSVPSLGRFIVHLYATEINSAGIALGIERECTELVQAAEIQELIHNWIDHHMALTMQQVSQRIGLTIITDPDKALYSEAKSNGANSALSVLQGMSKQESIDNLDVFAPFLKEVEKCYQPTMNQCIDSLLNLCRYEMLLLENKILQYVINTLDAAPNSTDPAVQRNLDKLIQRDPRLSRFSLLERRLDDLQKLSS